MEKVDTAQKTSSELLSPKSTFSGNTLADSPDLEAQDSESASQHQSPSRRWPWCWFTKRQCVNDDASTKLKTRTIEECPNGYPRLACFLSSDSNFTTYRGFSYLHSRILLNSQAELAELESQLEKLDSTDAELEETGVSTGLDSRKRDVRLSTDQQGLSRQTLLADIKAKLLEYDEILMKAREISTLQRPSNRDYRSVCNWLDAEQPLVESEQAFIRCREDLYTFRHGRECAGFEGAVESTLHKLPKRLTQKLFLTPELRQKTKTNIVYFSSSRIDAVTNLIIAFVIFVLLILPVLAMYRLTSSGGSRGYFNAIGVLIVFTLLFGAAMSMLTKARRHELFAASAAYCAVLVVFIGNFGGLGGPV